jgi:hypothetical protein
LQFNTLTPVLAVVPWALLPLSRQARTMVSGSQGMRG